MALGCRGGPARRRISRCEELRGHFARPTKGGIIKEGEIFLDRAAHRVRRQACGTLHAAAVADIGRDQAGVDGKALTTDKALIDAALEHQLKQAPQQVAVAKTAMSV